MTAPSAQTHAWRVAATGEPAALEQLAVDVGAAGLLEGAALGGDVGRTALLALPLATDAEAVMGTVCPWLDGAAPEDIEPLLRAVHGVLSRPPLGRERHDPDAVAACEVALTALAQRSELDPDERDLAASALAMVRAGAARAARKGLSSPP